MPKERLLEMGKIGKAHSLKGELSLIWHGENLPKAQQQLILEDSEGKRHEYLVENVRLHKGRPLVMLSGIADRNAAENLQGNLVFMMANQLPQPEEDESWLADLLGMDVCLPDGTNLGKLDHVEFPAGQEIWSIIDAADREILFPAQPDFLLSVDLDARKITINPPDGLIEIYNA